MAPNDRLVIKQPVPMRKQVYEHLRTKILERTIPPASRLIEAQIAKEIGISRTPVREALHLLEKDGFLESLPRVGYCVKTLAWDELDEIFEIRLVNELLACRWAIQKLNDKHLDKLEKNLEMVKAGLSKNEPNDFLHFDEEFHEIIFQAAGSRHLLGICQQLHRLMLRYRAESINSNETVKEALKGHKKILVCLRARDETGLEAAMYSHLEFSKKDIRREKQEDSSIIADH